MVFALFIALGALLILMLGVIANLTQAASWLSLSPRARRWTLIIAVVLVVLMAPYLYAYFMTSFTSASPISTSGGTATAVVHTGNTNQKPATPVSGPVATITPRVTPAPAGTTPAASPTDWGSLAGASISVNKLLTCGPGCPELLHLKIETIQIDTTNDLMTWNAHFLAPTSGASNGIADVSFTDFALQSNTTPFNQATQAIDSPGNLQAKFPFTPVPNEVYTFTVIASYHTLKDGIVTIQPTTLQYEQVTMSFQL